MPKIEWTNLPDAIRKHLLLRLKEREITEDDLYRLKLWRDTEPGAPRVPGTRTSARSRSAARVATRRRSC